MLFFCSNFTVESEALSICQLKIYSAFAYASCKTHGIPQIGNYTQTYKMTSHFRKHGTWKLTDALDLTCSF